jgi:hypothetical protein
MWISGERAPAPPRAGEPCVQLTHAIGARLEKGPFRVCI